MTKGVLSVAAAAVLLLVGCTSAPEDPYRQAVLAAAAAAKESGNEFLYSVFEDGEVTPAEHGEALDEFLTCLEDAGLSTTPPVRSPADGLRFIFDIDSNGVHQDLANAAQARCSDEFYVQVDALYVSTHEQVMEASLLRASLECLDAAGFPPSGSETNFKDMIGDPDADGGAQREAALDCVGEAASKLYPELNSLGVSD